MPRWPSVFLKAPSCIVGPGDPIVRPPTTEQLDYEVELAVVIGKRAKSVSKEQALEYVAGYTIMNDVSARDLQLGKDGGIILGKNFDTSAPLGPCIALSDELPDPSNLGIRTWVNGELRQNGNTHTLIFDVAAIIAFLTQQLTWRPGDVIATGTPAWRRAGHEAASLAPARRLHPDGDRRHRRAGEPGHPVTRESTPDGRGYRLADASPGRGPTHGQQQQIAVGATFPQTEIGADVGGVRAYAEAAQDLGFNHLLIYDHVLGADPDAPSTRPGPARTPPTPCSTRCSSCSATWPPPPRSWSWSPRRHPAAAPDRPRRQAGRRDRRPRRASSGSASASAGTGSSTRARDELQEPARRFEEQIEPARALARADLHPSRPVRAGSPQRGINPLPIQRPIPIWIGGSAEPALKRAAEIADGYFPQRPLEGGWPETLAKMKRLARGQAWTGPASASRPDQRRTPAHPDDWRATYEEWKALGATHITVNTMNGGLQGPEAHIKRIREVKDTPADRRPPYN